MSRTTRKCPPWAARWALRIAADPSYFYGKGDPQRCKWLHGYDGVNHDIGTPIKNSPRGFDRWGEVSSGNRRWAKRGAAKVIRRRFKKEIAVTLYESGDFSVAGHDEIDYN